MYCNVRPENIQFGRQYQERCHGKIQKKIKSYFEILKEDGGATLSSNKP